MVGTPYCISQMFPSKAHSLTQGALMGTLRMGLAGREVPRRGGGRAASPLQVPNVPGIRTGSSSQLWLDAGSLLNTAGGDRQGRAEESLTDPTRNVPVTTGTARGSAVRKRTMLDPGDRGQGLSGCLEGPFWGGSQKQSRSLSWQLEEAPVLFSALGNALLATSQCQAAPHPPALSL